MRHQIKLAVMAAITVGGLSFCAAPSFADGASATAKSGNASMSMDKCALPAGVMAKDLGDDTNIREALGDVVAASVKDKGFSDVADCFVKQDATRLKQYKEEDGDKLTEIATKFKADWKAKYGKEFDFSNDQSKQTFAGVTIMAGEVQTPDQLVGNWPVKQCESASLSKESIKGDDNAKLAASKQDINEAKSDMFGGDVKLEKGRDVAVVAVPSAMGQPEIRCSMIKEHVSGWHLDVPNDITGQQLHDNLVKQLTMIVDHESDWPTDVNAAYGVVGHHIIEAVYDIDGMKKMASAK